MERINQDIKTKQFGRLYVLCGDDDYFRNFYKNKLKKALEVEENAMNYTEFNGKGVDENSIMDAARTVPFFAERRVVLVNDSDLFKGSKKASDDESDELSDTQPVDTEEVSMRPAADNLPAFLAEIPDTTVLIFCESNVDRRTALFKAATKYGYIATFDKIKENEQGYDKIKWYMGQKLQRENKNMTREALRIFQERTGTDLRVVLTELDKLIIYTMGREVITEDDVKLLTPERVEDKIFEMIECMTKRQQKRALDLYYDLVKKKEEPVKILLMIEKYYHQLYVVKSLSEAGVPWKEILEKADVAILDFLYKKYSAIASKYSYDDLKKAMEMCIDYDKAFRSGRMKGNIAVEMVIVAMSTRGGVNELA